MDLFYQKYGESGPPLIILHGMYGSGDNWVSIARDLASDFEVYVVDQRNHGRSPHSDVHDYPAMRDDLCEFMDTREIQEAALIGHSMGGKTIMFFAEKCRDRIQSLISVDIAPKAYHELATDSRAAANHAKIIDSLMELDLSKAGSREDIDKQLSTRIGSERVRRFLLKNVERKDDGEFRWQLNLKALRDNLEKIMDGMDIEKFAREGGITGFPVLFISGEDSDYIRPEDHHLIHSVFPVAKIATIPGAGHWVHAEQPDLLIKNIRYFLDI